LGRPTGRSPARRARRPTAAWPASSPGSFRNELGCRSSAAARPTIDTDGPRVRAFAHRYVRHTKGRWAGQPLTFEPWQQEFLDEAFSIDPATGLRIYREVLLGIPRKNGKSTIASAIALYLLTSDGENEPEVYAAAAAKNQAGIVFRQSKRFVEASPGLRDFVRPKQYHMDCPQNGGIFRVLSSDAALQHGLNPHGVIVDELHAHKKPDLYTALTTGGGAREQPLTVTITTSGMDEEQILGVIYNAALEKTDLLEARPGLTIVRDPASAFLMFWYGAAPDADPSDPAVWKLANPASWITEHYLRTELAKPTMRLADFRRWHLNQWPSGVEDWLSQGAWGKLSTRNHDPKNLLHGLDPKRPVAVGIDFGVADDTTCVTVAQRIPMPIGRRYPETPMATDRVMVRSRFFVPDLSAGEEADVTAILDYLRSLRIRFPVLARKAERRGAGGPVFAYDPWGFKAMAQILEGEGLLMVEMPQNDSRMVPAATELYGLVMTGRLEHDGDPLLAQHMANVVGKARGESGWRITKLPNSRRKIDGAISTAMAVHEALQPWPAPRMSAFVA
jgi:phage terminase large subunit-like protein